MIGDVDVSYSFISYIYISSHIYHSLSHFMRSPKVTIHLVTLYFSPRGLNIGIIFVTVFMLGIRCRQPLFYLSMLGS
jgi:hypothetical protein